jgi:hypothetical protein
MEDQSPKKIILRWTPLIMRQMVQGWFKHVDRETMRENVVRHIDDRGLSLGQAAALHALDNTEEVKKQLGDLLTPRPGERSNLDRILILLEAMAKSQIESQKLLKEVCERLSALEAQSFVLNATSPSPSST